jgi:16S rRNA processing protein RimM
VAKPNDAPASGASAAGGAPDLIAVGRVRRAHGIRGEVVVEVLTDAPGAVFAPGRRVFAGTERGTRAPGGAELHVKRSATFKDGLIVGFAELQDRNAAESWRDRLLLVPADELEPPGEHEIYIHDLVGMEVVLPTGETVGVVGEVFELPQGLMLDVERAGGGTVMIPFHESAVAFVDRSKRIVHIDPPAGLLD